MAELSKFIGHFTRIAPGTMSNKFGNFIKHTLSTEPLAAVFFPALSWLLFNLSSRKAAISEPRSGEEAAGTMAAAASSAMLFHPTMWNTGAVTPSEQWQYCGDQCLRHFFCRCCWHCCCCCCRCYCCCCCCRCLLFAVLLLPSTKETCDLESIVSAHSAMPQAV